MSACSRWEAGTCGLPKPASTSHACVSVRGYLRYPAITRSGTPVSLLYPDPVHCADLMRVLALCSLRPWVLASPACRQIRSLSCMAWLALELTTHTAMWSSMLLNSPLLPVRSITTAFAFKMIAAASCMHEQLEVYCCPPVTCAPSICLEVHGHHALLHGGVR